MSLEIKVNDEFVPIENAGFADLVELEMALSYAMKNPDSVKVTSTKEIPVNFCNICNQPHAGLYCTNCLTGKRVNISKRPNGFRFVNVIKLTPINTKFCK
jgi:hypothetical protein